MLHSPTLILAKIKDNSSKKKLKTFTHRRCNHGDIETELNEQIKITGRLSNNKNV